MKKAVVSGMVIVMASLLPLTASAVGVMKVNCAQKPTEAICIYQTMKGISTSGVPDKVTCLDNVAPDVNSGNYKLTNKNELAEPMRSVLGLCILIGSIKPAKDGVADLTLCGNEEGVPIFCAPKSLYREGEATVEVKDGKPVAVRPLEPVPPEDVPSVAKEIADPNPLEVIPEVGGLFIWNGDGLYGVILAEGGPNIPLSRELLYMRFSVGAGFADGPTPGGERGAVTAFTAVTRLVFRVTESFRLGFGPRFVMFLAQYSEYGYRDASHLLLEAGAELDLGGGFHASLYGEVGGSVKAGTPAGGLLLNLGYRF